MFYKKTDYPEEGDIVLCTVKKILFHSIFAYLDEFKNLEGMIHISEVSPGRIRNIRDYVKEGKKVVCKILRIDKQKGHIDLSIRRVNNSQRINKNQEYKQEQKAEKLLELIGKEQKISLDKMYKEAGQKLIDEFGSLYNSFQNIVADPKSIDKLEINKKINDSLVKKVQEKIKPPEVQIKITLTLKSDSPKGIDIIKETLSKIKTKGVSINYISAPTYSITIKASDYKKGEAIFKKIEQTIEKVLESSDLEGELERNA